MSYLSFLFVHCLFLQQSAPLHHQIPPQSHIVFVFYRINESIFLVIEMYRSPCINRPVIGLTIFCTCVSYYECIFLFMLGYIGTIFFRLLPIYGLRSLVVLLTLQPFSIHFAYRTYFFTIRHLISLPVLRSLVVLLTLQPFSTHFAIEPIFPQ